MPHSLTTYCTWWRGVVMTPRAVAEIERLRRSPAEQTTVPTEEVIAA